MLVLFVKGKLNLQKLFWGVQGPIALFLQDEMGLSLLRSWLTLLSFSPFSGLERLVRPTEAGCAENAGRAQRRPFD